MKTILILDSTLSDNKVPVSQLVRKGYEFVVADCLTTGEEEVKKLPPGAVIVAAAKFCGGTARELINWMKTEGYKFPVIAIVDNLNPMELIELMRDWGAINIIQRGAIDKQLIEMVDLYASSENIMFILDNTLIPRKSADFRGIEQSIEKIGATNANVIIFGEIGMGREQVARGNL